MSPPTPETMSIIVLESVSSRICTSTSKSPDGEPRVRGRDLLAVAGSAAQKPKNATSAPPNARKVVSVEIQPAVRREIRPPASVIATAPPSGANEADPRAGDHRSHGARSPGRRRGHAAPRHRDDETEADRDLRGGDRHHREREDLAVEVALLPRERDEREVRRVQHDLEREEHDQRAAPQHHSERADSEQDRRDDQVPADVGPSI